MGTRGLPATYRKTYVSVAPLPATAPGTGRVSARRGRVGENAGIFEHPTFVIVLLVLRLSLIQQKLDEQAGPDAGGTFGDVRPFPFAPIGTGDVEVDPGILAHELAEEHGGGDHPASPPADIAHVGHVAVKLLKIFLPEG